MTYRPHKKIKTVPVAAPTFAERVQAVPVELTTEQLAEIAAQIPPTDISGKVDKVTGKGLSANDYTTEEKNKLAGLGGTAVTPTNWGKYF